MALTAHFSIGLYYVVDDEVRIAFEFNRVTPGRIISAAIVDAFTLSLVDLRAGVEDAKNFLQFIRNFTPDEPVTRGIRQPFTIERESRDGIVSLKTEIGGELVTDVEWIKETNIGTVNPRPADDLSIDEFKVARLALDDWVTECERVKAEE